MSVESTVPANPPLATTPSPASGVTRPQGGRIAWIVIGLAVVVGIVMGFVLFMRAKDADISLRQWMASYKDRGQSLSADGCVTDAIDYFEKTCSAPLEMCLQAVPMGVGHCLKAKDRQADCTAVGNTLKDEKWSFHKCQDVGVDKSSKKPLIKACTAAWDALDSYCRSGQKGVIL